MKARYIAPIVIVAGALVLGYRYAKTCETAIQIGIHFHGSPVDFGAPPPRFQVNFEDDYRDIAPWRASSLKRNDDFNDDPAEDAKGKRAAWDNKMKAADQLALACQYAKAIEEYRALNKSGAGYTAYCVRRVELLKALGGHPATPAVKALLEATDFDSKSALPEPSALPADLRPYVDYEKASRAYESEHYPEAENLYRTCAKGYPKSDLADAALMMAARSSLQGDTVTDLNQPAGDLQTLITGYPHSRFKASALGWKARIAFLQKDYRQAIGLYKIQLGCSLTHVQRYKALNSLAQCDGSLNRPDLVAADWIRIFGISQTLDEAMYSASVVRPMLSRLSPTDSAKLAGDLKEDASLLAAYIQLRLEMSRTNKKERTEVARIAKGCSHVTPKLLARLAQVAYSDNEMADCRTFASRAALGAAYGTEEWGISHYLLGSCAQRSGQFRNAVREYKLVASDGPKDYLAVGAREALALLYDRQGRPGESLDQLYWLRDWTQKNKGSAEFTFDIAYMLDAKMTPKQIERYLATHPNNGHKWLLRYTIGLRYLRENKFTKAEQNLASIPNKVRLPMVHTAVDDASFETGRVQDPLNTAKDLAQLTYEANSARGSAAKSKKLLELASYYYTRRNLLLYNAPLWRDGRAMAIGWSWNPQTASAADNAALTRHHLEHECLQHTVDICASILKRYPKTESAPLAAYRAACAEERLSNFNPWWRWEAAHDGLLAKAVSFMDLVVTRYPHISVASDARQYRDVFKHELSDKKKYLPTGVSRDVFGGWMGSYAYLP
jgi:outer membrane protein assembly factor BamD (BamD/ComL family)